MGNEPEIDNNNNDKERNVAIMKSILTFMHQFVS